MKRYLLTFLLAIIISGNSSAQSEFMNGYIIKNDGSYTYGQVAYIAKGYTVNECLFRWFDISTEYTFKPGEIAAFGFTHGMRFRSVTVGQRKIFMSCLTDGDLDLLYDGSKLYLDGTGLVMTPLDNGSGSVNAGGKMVSFSGFRDLLEKLPDPEGKFKVPADISLSPEKMAVVIADYNRSRGEEVKIFAARNPEGIYEEMRNLGAYTSSYGILAGMNASKYYAEKVNYSHLGFLPEMDFFEVTPLIGLFYNRPLSRKTDLLSFNAELLAFRTNVYMYDEFTEYNGITRSDINISYTGIKLPLSLRLTFLEGSFKPFLNAGIYGVAILGGKYSREGEVENAMHVVRPFTDNSISINSSVRGFMGGIGLKKELNPKQCVTLELRAEYGTGIYNREGIKQNTISFNVIAGIDFF